MKAEDLINKHLTIEGGSDYAITDGVIYNAVINALNEAINYTRCCTELKVLNTNKINKLNDALKNIEEDFPGHWCRWRNGMD